MIEQDNSALALREKLLDARHRRASSAFKKAPRRRKTSFKQLLEEFEFSMDNEEEEEDNNEGKENGGRVKRDHFRKKPRAEQQATLRLAGTRREGEECANSASTGNQRDPSVDNNFSQEENAQKQKSQSCEEKQETENEEEEEDNFNFEELLENKARLQPRENEEEEQEEELNFFDRSSALKARCLKIKVTTPNGRCTGEDLFENNLTSKNSPSFELNIKMSKANSEHSSPMRKSPVLQFVSEQMEEPNELQKRKRKRRAKAQHTQSDGESTSVCSEFHFEVLEHKVRKLELVRRRSSQVDTITLNKAEPASDNPPKQVFFAIAAGMLTATAFSSLMVVKGLRSIFR